MEKEKVAQSSPSVEQKEVKDLDSLIEILSEDDLRNVAGGMTDRPKGQPGEGGA